MKAELEGPNLIGRMPLHVLIQIFSNLSLHDRKNSSLACIYFCNVLYIVRQLDHSKIILNDASFNSISTTKLPRDRVEIQNLRTNLAISSRRNTWFKDIKSLLFLESAEGTSVCNLLKILRNSTKLERLDFQVGALDLKNASASHGLARIRLQLLKNLMIDTFSKDHGMIGAIENLMKANFPALEIFQLRFVEAPNSKVFPTNAQFVKLYSEIYGFLGRHAESLKKVSLLKPEEIRNTGQGPMLPLDIHPKLLKLNLNRFEVFTGEYETVYSLDSSLVAGATELKQLRLTGFPIRPPFTEVIRRNARTIEELEWNSRNPPTNGGPPTTFDIETIANSMTLKTLTVECSILVNFQRLPVSITKLVLKSYSLDASQMIWMGNSLHNLKYFVYLRHLTEEEFFIPITLNSIQFLLFNLPLEKLGAYCAGNIAAVREYVEQTEGLQEIEGGSVADSGTIFINVRR